MKRKNLIIRYFGLFLLIVGIVLNIKMYIEEAWPTYLFYIISAVGLIQIIASFFAKKMKIGWQIFWSLLPVLLGFVCFKIW
jgi:hypothetical protein